MRVLTMGTAIVLPALLSSPVLAQELTSEQMINLFQKQVEAQEQPLTRSLGGQRSLSLITVDDVQAEPVVVDEAVTEDVAVAPAAPTPALESTDVTATAPTGLVQPLDGSGQTVLPATEGGTVSVAGAKPLQPAITDPNAPLVYAQLQPDLQVNLQIKFGFDSAALSNSEKPKLATLCAAMKATDIRMFRIIGHTDTAGADTYNERLSILRAKEVARHLVQDCGIAASRLETVGLGERFPSNTQDTRADENRRVEFQALS